ncbi:hypothetical protein ACFFP0_09550 [Rhizobium puerariae]|uniref:Uncharacterized protein n=1 Tax=Rhizobium puerariae TaxID=1585791 RepID=A0ABV6AEP4_9HYPH
MYVVSVLDKGDQRTFLSENLKIIDRIVYATISGVPKEFMLSEIIDIVPVDAKPEKEPTARLRSRHVQ